MKGVSSIAFHKWVSGKVAQVDPTFEFEGFIGRGRQTQSIRKALVDWAVDDGPCLRHANILAALFLSK